MFKCFKFIDDMMKQLNEADEMPMEDDAEMDGDEAAQKKPAQKEPTDGEDMPEEDDSTTEDKDAQNPQQIADVESGVFVSQLTKANWANMLLKFLKNKNPDILIPSQFETVTTKNADAIIQFVKSADILLDDSYGDELNNI